MSIDVGVVTGIGYIAEPGAISRQWAENLAQTQSEQELHGILGWACHPDRRITSPWSTQIITGAGRRLQPTRKSRSGARI